MVNMKRARNEQGHRQPSLIAEDWKAGKGGYVNRYANARPRADHPCAEDVNIVESPLPFAGVRVVAPEFFSIICRELSVSRCRMLARRPTWTKSASSTPISLGT
jgi:hypothetical protein